MVVLGIIPLFVADRVDWGRVGTSIIKTLTLEHTWPVISPSSMLKTTPKHFVSSTCSESMLSQNLRNEDLVRLLCRHDKDGDFVLETDKFHISSIDNFARNGEPPGNQKRV